MPAPAGREFEGRTALVTGAGSGIGRATALALARAGARVALLGRGVEALEETLEMLRPEESGALVVPCDLTDRGMVREAVACVRSALGTPTLLVNNAGIFPRKGLLDTDDETWDRTVAVNLTAIFLLCRETVPAMIEAGGGVIVNVASTLGFVGIPHGAAYCATKAGVLGLTRALALEVAKGGVRVHAVCPGIIDTPMSYRDRDPSVPREEWHRIWAGQYPLGRIGRPEEVAEMIVFLLSDRCGFATGGAFPVDGGYLAR